MTRCKSYRPQRESNSNRSFLQIRQPLKTPLQCSANACHVFHFLKQEEAKPSLLQTQHRVTEPKRNLIQITRLPKPTKSHISEHHNRNETTQTAFSPSNSPRRERRTIINGRWQLHQAAPNANFTLRRKRCVSSSWFRVLYTIRETSLVTNYRNDP